MKNLKRALGLAMTGVMLLGMMVTGAGASNFTDADQIRNTQAVAITSGLGLFVGSDGKFMPKDTVTRAQMATIVVKMLYGSEINADAYKGVNKFSDVADFESGWAEGYINLCADRGIVGGYGDGTFRPGQTVTTAEAATMIINALKVDAGEGTWPLTVMAKAEEMKLFADLATKPETNEGLTRDELAGIVLNGLQYSPEGVSGYVVNGVTYDDYFTAWIAAGQDPSKISVATKDTLATKVFGMKTAEGFVTENRNTGAEATVIGGEHYDIDTGLDMIGRWVKVYFKETYEDRDEPGLTYAVVDETRVVSVEQDIDNRKDYRAAFGTKDIPQAKSVLYIASDFVSDPQITAVDGYAAGGENYSAPAGTYVIYDGEIIAYRAPVEVYAAKVTKVDATAGKENIKPTGALTLPNNENEDVVVEYKGIAKDDYVTYIKAGGMYVLTKMDTVSGQVSSINTNPDNGRFVLTVNDKQYEYFGAKAENVTISDLTIVDSAKGFDPDTFNFNNNYTLYLSGGKLVAISAAASQTDVSGMVYVSHVYEVEKSDSYGKPTVYTYAQGADMNGKEVNILINVTVSGQSVLKDASKVLAEDATGFYSFQKNTEKDAAKYGIMTAEAAKTEYGKTNSGNAGPIYTEMTQSAESLNSKTKYVYTQNGPAYLTENTKFIMISEENGSQMEIGMSIGSITYNMKAPAQVLLSKNAAGNTLLEVMVIVSDPAQVLSEDIIYVSDSQLNYVAKNANGYVYEVYNAKTGKVMEMTMDSANAFAESGEGFYAYSYNENEKLHELGQKFEDAAVSGAYSDQTFVSWYNGMLATTDIDHVSTTEATVVIDTRSKEEMDASEIGTIADMEDIVFLTGGEEVHTVVLDVLVDVETEKVIAVFVTDVIAPVEEA